MTIRDNNKRHARHVAGLITAARSPDTGILSGIWSWINGVASGVAHFLGGPVTSALRALLAAVKDIVDAYFDMIVAILRVRFWLELYVIRRIVQYVNHQFAIIRARERRIAAYLTRLIYVTTQYVLAFAATHIRAETVARIRAVHHAESLAQLRLRHMHATIEREAASAYRLEDNSRLNIITRLLDYAVLRNPAVKRIVSAITAGILDLAAVDDPPLRLLLGFLITKVIDRLGVDKAAGTLARDLLEPVLGHPRPGNLHDVIADIATRLAAGEQQWAQFMESGGSQIEQAGQQWRDITSVIGNAAILAFAAQAVVDPDGWAKEIRSTIGKPANDLAARASALFRGG